VLDKVIDGPGLRQAATAEAVLRQLGGTLVDAKLLDEPGLARAIRATGKAGERLDTVLASLGLVSELDIARALSTLLKLPLAGPSDYPAEPILTDTVKISFIRQHRIIPLSVTDTGVIVAVVDPFNTESSDALAYLMGKPVTRCLTAPGDFEKAIAALYLDEAKSGAPAEPEETSDASDDDIERLRDIASQAPTIRLVNQIIADAVELRASDIHIEPQESTVHVRYRIDGELRPARQLAPGQRSAVSSRIKVMARMNIAERRLPQDGRIKTAIRGQDLDLRVSTTPTLYGESIVLRILDRSSVALDFAALGFQGETLTAFRKLLAQPNGIILVTGPTGSGKTTTLYTALRELNQPNVKIFTVEDPIEYQLGGMNQIQVQPKIGLDFAAALRSILRQDPDIIMIGEIRDLETAQIAIQASLTGHLVFSTLHTNSAASTITRLLDMGVEDYLLASTLKGVLAQRLVRRLCRHCSVRRNVAPEVAQRLLAQPGHVDAARSAERLSLPEAVGCEQCGTTGYSGRTTITELLPVDERVQRLIVGSRSDREIEQAAVEGGMVTLYQDGLGRVLAGETTMGEVLQVAQAQ
jgi:general secretion pathway protein E